MLSALRRLIVPAAVFLVCVSLGAHDGHGLVRTLERATGALPEIIETLAWISGAWLINSFARYIVWDKVIGGLLRAPVPGLLVQLSGILVYSLSLVGIVGVVFQRSVSGLLAASGAVGIILAMALRSLILDAFSGIAINIDQPFSIGEFIQVHARGVDRIRGRVRQIDWRATSIETPEGNVVIVPNSELGAAVITNFSRPSAASEQELVLTFDCAIPSERVLRVLNASLVGAVGAGGPLAEPPPKVRLSGVDERGARYKLVYWCDAARTGPGKVKHIVLQHALDHLRVAGVAVAASRVDTAALDYGYLGYRTALLSRVALFAGLSSADVELLATQMTAREFKPGERIVRRGDPGGSLFVLVEGLLDVYVEGGKGEDVRRSQMAPGAFFGEISLLTGEPRTATVVASTETLVYEITKEHMSRALDLRPELAQALCDAAAERRLKQNASTKQGGATSDTGPSLSAQILGQMRAFFGRVFRKTQAPS